MAKIRGILRSLYQNSGASTQIAIATTYEALKASPRYAGPANLVRSGYKVYSQCDEDGIIAEIFTRIGTTSKTFVEFGIGDGRENNTLALLFRGWKGLWIEASEVAARNIATHYRDVMARGSLAFEQAFIDKDNINGIISRHLTGEIDLLSVDIDGNDWHVYEAIRSINPRVIVFEYNAKFAPPISFCMGYDPKYVRRGDDCFGFSLQYITDRMSSRGYRLVGCNLSGANAFFVRDDVLSDKFQSPYTAEHHYEPARYYLTLMQSGHAPSYETLARAMRGTES